MSGQTGHESSATTGFLNRCRKLFDNFSESRFSRLSCLLSLYFDVKSNGRDISFKINDLIA